MTDLSKLLSILTDIIVGNNSNNKYSFIDILIAYDLDSLTDEHIAFFRLYHRKIKKILVKMKKKFDEKQGDIREVNKG